MLPRSLTLRLALLSAAWVALGLAVAGWLILQVLSDERERASEPLKGSEPTSRKGRAASPSP
jgi:hypothetical protein